DGMPEALRQIGLDVSLLSQSDLEQGDLSRFDAIVAGVRAYNVRSDLRANHPRLLQYVNNGGTYVVQYQSGGSPPPGGGRGAGRAQGGGPGRGTPGQAPGTPATPGQTPATPAPVFLPPEQTPTVKLNIGPYPITIPAGNGFRVTVEEAPVAFPHVDSL